MQPKSEQECFGSFSGKRSGVATVIVTANDYV